jgi:P4 family phage/plasmid primase-like protien
MSEPDPFDTSDPAADAELDAYLALLFPEPGDLVNVRLLHPEWPRARRDDETDEQWMAFVRRCCPSPRLQHVVPRSDVRALVRAYERNRPERNVYVGTVARRERDGGGSKRNLGLARVLWCELDSGPAATLAGLYSECTYTFGDIPRPSGVIESSPGRLHAYWRLREPIDASSPEGAARLEAMVRGIALMLGGDTNACDAARILRPPTTTNHPSPDKRALGRVDSPVRILELTPGLEYDVDAFAACEARGAAARPTRVRPASGGGTEQNPLDPEQLGRLLALIRATDYRSDKIDGGTCSRAEWFGLLCDARALTAPEDDEDGLAVVLEWAATDEEHDDEASADGNTAIWHSIARDGRRNGGGLFAAAAEVTGRELGDIVREIRGIEDEPATGFPAVEPEPAGATTTLKKRPVVLSYKTPHKSAVAFQRARPHLRRFRNEWCEYDGGAYVVREDSAVERDVVFFLDSAKIRESDGKGGFTSARYDVNPSRIDGVKRSLRAIALVEDRAGTDGLKAEPPFWIDGAGDDPRDLIVVRNGILNTRTRTLQPHTPRLFTHTLVPYDYDPHAAAPEWLRFVDSIFPDDRPSADLLQEMFGYLVSADTSLQCIFALIGKPASGKGTVGRVVSALVGPQNVTSPTIGSLAGAFGMQSLLYKSLALIGDARIGPRTDKATLLETLLSISGEDNKSVNRKNTTAWEGRLGVRIMLIANRFPNLSDETGALARRIVPLRFSQSFEGREDGGLTDRLTAELPGILVWSLDGLARLRRAGRFTETPAGLSTLRELRAVGSPVSRFAADRLVFEPSARALCGDVYPDYQAWCSDKGERPLTAAELGGELHELFSIESKRRRIGEGDKRPWFYIGVRLTDAMRATTEG